MNIRQHLRHFQRSQLARCFHAGRQAGQVVLVDPGHELHAALRIVDTAEPVAGTDARTDANLESRQPPGDRCVAVETLLRAFERREPIAQLLHRSGHFLDLRLTDPRFLALVTPDLFEQRRRGLALALHLFELDCRNMTTVDECLHAPVPGICELMIGLELEQLATVRRKARRLRTSFDRHVRELLRDFGATREQELFHFAALQPVQRIARIDEVAVPCEDGFDPARLGCIELYGTYGLDTRTQGNFFAELAGDHLREAWRVDDPQRDRRSQRDERRPGDQRDRNQGAIEPAAPCGRRGQPPVHGCATYRGEIVRRICTG